MLSAVVTASVPTRVPDRSGVCSPTPRAARELSMSLVLLLASKVHRCSVSVLCVSDTVVVSGSACPAQALGRANFTKALSQGDLICRVKK